jgi:DnaA family protein
MRQLALGIRLRDEATFATFVVGANAEPVAAVRAGAAPSIWLWGPSGSGKSHLLQAACAAVGAPAAYLSLEPDDALPAEALAGFERAGLVCIDAVDAIAGDTRWERALFALYNACTDLGTRMIFAARAAPRTPAWALDDWRSRAAASVVYQLRDLDEAGRIEALRRRAERRGIELPAETVDYLMRRQARDLRSLLALLDALDQASLAAQRRLTVPFIRAALERIEGTRS